MERRISPLRDFLARESASGILLMIAAAMGLLAANLPSSQAYFDLLGIAFTIDFLGIYIELTVLKVINYGLMTIFFFVVGLEIKREITSGHLSKLRQAAAPFFAAVGGMAVPALIYLAIAGDVAHHGWAIPVATDIALAVGVLSMMGSRVSQGMKAFLLALAVIDDIGAILIIAIFYSAGIIFSWLMGAVLAVIGVLLLQRLGVMNKFAYFVVGLLLWYALYKAGLHPTLAGVVMGLLAPATPLKNQRIQDVEYGEVTIVEELEEQYHSLSSLVVIPIFAFANSGVVLSANAVNAAISSPIAWGIVLGLAAGKPLGIFLSSRFVEKIKVAELPIGSTNKSLIATGGTAGIGFTVAIFISKLAFDDVPTQDLAVTAVIVGSILSGLLSVILFRLGSKNS